MDSSHKGPDMQKLFPCPDIIMCYMLYSTCSYALTEFDLRVVCRVLSVAVKMGIYRKT